MDIKTDREPLEEYCQAYMPTGIEPTPEMLLFVENSFAFSVYVVSVRWDEMKQSIIDLFKKKDNRHERTDK